jgi:hypothetical protein
VACCSKPVIKQGESGLFAAMGTKTDQARLRPVAEDVEACALLRGKPRPFERRINLGPGQRTVSQRRLKDRPATIKDSLIETDAAQDGPGPFVLTRASQGKQPAEICCGHEVDGPAQRPGADNLPVRNRALDVGGGQAVGALADSPESCAKVLRLDRAEPFDDFESGLSVRASQQLLPTATEGNLVTHGPWNVPLEVRAKSERA